MWVFWVINSMEAWFLTLEVIAEYSWHSSPPIPSCLYSLLHFSCVLSITVYSWAPVFEIIHSRHLFSFHFHCAVNLPLIHAHVGALFCLSPIDFHSFAPKHISSSSASLLPVPCTRYRSQCHRHTSWVVELPLWYHPSSYPSSLQTNKCSKPILGAVPPSPRTSPSLLPHNSPLL